MNHFLFSYVWTLLGGFVYSFLHNAFFTKNIVGKNVNSNLLPDR